MPQGDKQFIFKIIQTADGHVAKRIEAKLGLRVPGKVEILEGLAPGDSVVTAGQARLLAADGVAVRVVDVAAAGAPPASAPRGAPAGAAARAASAV